MKAQHRTVVAADELTRARRERLRRQVEALSEGTRRAIDTSLRHPIWCDATDHELAEQHGVSVDVLRALRAEHRRAIFTADVLARLARLREATAWDGTDAELLTHCIESYRIGFERYARTSEKGGRDD